MKEKIKKQKVNITEFALMLVESKNLESTNTFFWEA